MSLTKTAVARTAMALALLITSPAHAGGTIGAAELLEQLNYNPQVAAALSQLQQITGNTDPVICSGGRYGRHWTFLGGGRTGPFTCEHGGKSLEIETSSTYFDEAGRPLSGNDPDIHAKAAKEVFKFVSVRKSW